MTDKYSEANYSMKILFDDNDGWAVLFTNNIKFISKEALSHLDEWLKKPHGSEPNGKFGRNNKGIEMIDKEWERRSNPGKYIIENGFNVERAPMSSGRHKAFGIKCSTCESENMERCDNGDLIVKVLYCRDCGVEVSDAVSD